MSRLLQPRLAAADFDVTDFDVTDFDVVTGPASLPTRLPSPAGGPLPTQLIAEAKAERRPRSEESPRIEAKL